MMKGNPNNSCMGAYADTLDIKVTDACNGICPFCIEKGGKESKSANVKLLIKKVQSINPRSVLILGGEPFLYKHLTEFIEGISKGFFVSGWHKRKIFITTNGSRLSDKVLLERIAPHLTAINISIQHFGMKKHNEITGVELNTNDLIEGIAILRKHNVSVRINSLLMKGSLDNREDCNTMTKFARVLGANELRFSELQDYPQLFVDAKTIFNNLNKSPFTEGCEQKFKFYKGIEVIIKQTCGLVNPIKDDGMPNIAVASKQMKKQGVLYPDLTHSSGWISSSIGCHGCHGKNKTITSCHGSSKGSEGNCHGKSGNGCGGSGVEVGCHGKSGTDGSCHGRNRVN